MLGRNCFVVVQLEHLFKRSIFFWHDKSRRRPGSP
jgi:hypothetical protein